MYGPRWDHVSRVTTRYCSYITSDRNRMKQASLHCTRLEGDFTVHDWKETSLHTIGRRPHSSYRSIAPKTLLRMTLPQRATHETCDARSAKAKLWKTSSSFKKHIPTVHCCAKYITHLIRVTQTPRILDRRTVATNRTFGVSNKPSRCRPA